MIMNCSLSNVIADFYIGRVFTLLRRGFGLKNWRKSGGKNEKKYEKRRKPLPDAIHKTRVIRGSSFSACMLTIITITILSLPVLNFSGYSCPSLANIAKLMLNAESCLGDYQGYHRLKVYCS